MKSARPNSRALQDAAKRLRCVVLAMVVLSYFALAVSLPVKSALACENCACIANLHNGTRNHIRGEHLVTQIWIETQFERHRDNFFVKFFFAENILAAMRSMTEQLVSTGMLQIMAVGAFFDAKEQMEVQRLFQELTAEAHRDYHPDTEMCTVGTATRSVAAAQRNAIVASHTMSRRLQDRQLGAGGTVGAGGRDVDKRSRLNKVLDTYCSDFEQFGNMQVICDATDEIKRGKDINYMKTVGLPMTINVDFTDTGTDDEKEHLFALGSNLFAHDTFFFLDQEPFRNPDNHPAYLDVRSVVAKRSVAEHSFNTIVGMKAAGTEESEQLAPFVARIYEQLGIDEEEARKLLGDRPSYHAQMEMLTKILYQRPDFYINLYTKPANIDRIGASVQAIGLMQGMDAFQSRLRSEMMLSVLLELEIRRLHNQTASEIDRLRAAGLPGSRAQ